MTLLVTIAFHYSSGFPYPTSLNNVAGERSLPSY